jgi:hypothetical protein
MSALGGKWLPKPNRCVSNRRQGAVFQAFGHGISTAGAPVPADPLLRGRLDVRLSGVPRARLCRTRTSHRRPARCRLESHRYGVRKCGSQLDASLPISGVPDESKGRPRETHANSGRILPKSVMRGRGGNPAPRLSGVATSASTEGVSGTLCSTRVTGVRFRHPQ